MLGLRQETDQPTIRLGVPSEHKRTSKFAERLHGRFFVAGVTGSFEKYSKFLKELEDKQKRIDNQNISDAALLDKKLRDELKKEAKKLLEMEQKLNEVTIYFYIY
jgi:hypothetical protein